jgi:hypothetical protein
VRAVTRNFLPECTRMIHVASVHKLVHQKIAHHLWGLKQQATVQTDGSPGGTASPTRALAANGHLLILISQAARAFGERRGENRTCPLGEPGTQGAPHQARIAGSADEAQYSWRNCARTKRASAAGEMDARAFSRGGKFDCPRRKGLNSSRAAPSVRELRLDPFAMAVKELR